MKARYLISNALLLALALLLPSLRDRSALSQEAARGNCLIGEVAGSGDIGNKPFSKDYRIILSRHARQKHSNTVHPRSSKKLRVDRDQVVVTEYSSTSQFVSLFPSPAALPSRGPNTSRAPPFSDSI
jgi:hypothetical protein